MDSGAGCSKRLVAVTIVWCRDNYRMIVVTVFEKLSVVPSLIVTPLVFLGGSFYSTDMLPPLWQSVSLLNPVLYLVSGLRWSFYEIAEVNIIVSLASITVFMLLCFSIVVYIFNTGYKLRH